VTTPEEPSEPVPFDPAIPSAAWAAPVPAPVAAPAPSAPWSSPGTIGPAPRQRVNGFAVASLVLGLTCWCGFVTGILAVIFGNLALGRIARSEGHEKGRGMAIAGIVLGWVSIAVLGGLAIAWFAYNFSNG
jgi:hypothetical protein